MVPPQLPNIPRGRATGRGRASATTRRRPPRRRNRTPAPATPAGKPRTKSSSGPVVARCAARNSPRSTQLGGIMASFFDRVVGAAKLDVATYEEVENDKGAMGQAMTVVVLASLS